MSTAKNGQKSAPSAELQAALALHQRGDLTKAEALYRAVLEKQPRDGEALHLLGLLTLQKGDAAAAERLLAQAITLQPKAALFHNHLGLARRTLGQSAAARTCFQEALALKPDLLEAKMNLALCAIDQGETQDAAVQLAAILQHQPDHLAALVNLAALRRGENNFDAAKALLDQALAKNPASIEARVQLALLQRDQGHLRDAEAALRQLLAQSPRPEVMVALANMLTDQNLFEEALALFDRVLGVQPSLAQARTNRGLCRLAKGDYLGGTEDFEARLALPTFAGLHRGVESLPQWDGKPFTGGLLLRGEQGFGDCLQLGRYLPLLVARGIQAHLECRAPLAPLFRSIEGLASVITDRDPLPKCDRWLAMMSLPHRFGTTPETIPPVPYLRADETKTQAWRQRLSGPGLKVGLAWRGSQRFLGDQVRALTLAKLAPVFEIAGIKWISLQFGPGIEEIAETGLPLQNFADEIKDFHDSAALVAALDLVVSIDSAPVHLAGALGRPTLLLLHAQSDWRWTRTGETSPWYPQIPILQQAKADDWSLPIARLVDRMKDLAG